MNQLWTLPLNKKTRLANIMKSKSSYSILIFLLALLLLAVPVSKVQAEYKVPSPASELYVLDQADVISDETKAMIIATSKELAQQTKAQVAVVTLSSLEDQPIEDVGLAILRDWKLGDKELNNGLLLLVAPNEREMRIEVGYGLEGALPDAKTGRIRDQYILPAFKQNDYDLGIRQGYIALVQEAAKEYNVTLNLQQPDTPVHKDAAPQEELPGWAIVLLIIGFIILFWLDQRFLGGFIFGVLLSALMRGGGRGGGGGFGGGSSGGGGSGGGGGSSGRW